MRPTNRFPLLTLAEGADPASVRFGELGYPEGASYLDFVAGARGRVAAGHPLPGVPSHAVRGGQLGRGRGGAGPVEAAYERAMVAEVAALCRHIPHGDLCIQWDLCNEMVIWDGQRTEAVLTSEPRAALLARMARICAAVPAGRSACTSATAISEVAIVEPRTPSAMVGFANALTRTIAHDLAYIHMRCRSSGRMTRFTGRSPGWSCVGNRPLPRRRALTDALTPRPPFYTPPPILVLLLPPMHHMSAPHRPAAPPLLHGPLALPAGGYLPPVDALCCRFEGAPRPRACGSSADPKVVAVHERG